MDECIGVALHGSHAYVTTQDITDRGGIGSIFSVALAGGTVTPLASSHCGGLIAVDDRNAYWTEREPYDPSSPCGAPLNIGTAGSVMSVPLSGGTPTTLAAGQIGPFGITVDGTNVYWTVLNGKEEPSTVGAVLRVPVAGGTPTTLASGLNAPWGIAVDATSVYWASGDGVMKLTPK